MKKDTRERSGLTVGVDLGDRWSRYCVLDAQGQVLEEDTIATTARALRKRFNDLSASRVVIEVGTHSPWVQRLLQELGHETITAHTQSVRLIYGSKDKNDLFRILNSSAPQDVADKGALGSCKLESYEDTPSFDA